MHFDVDAILFDIDGTLVDSTASVERTWTRWCAEFGVDVDDLLQHSHGRRSEDTIAMYLPVEQIPAALAFLDGMEEDDIDDVTALPATADLLATLPAGRWAAVTSGGRTLMQIRLRAAGLPVPPVMVTSEDVTVGKPDPQGYRLAAERLGFDPERCLVIEDAPAGIRAGLGAGGPVIGVATSHPVEAIDEAHVVVPDLTHVKVIDEGSSLRVEVA